MDFSNLYRSYQIKAVESVLDPDEAYFYRKVCRWYSTKFHTPLLTVESLPLDQILTNYYESTMESISYNDLYDIAIEDFLPEIQEENDKETEALMADLEKEQAEQLAKKEAKIPKSHKQPKPTEDSTPDVNIKFDDDME